MTRFGRWVVAAVTGMALSTGALTGVPPAGAGVVGSVYFVGSPGTSAPPTRLGATDVTPMTTDDQREGPVTDLSSTEGTVGFSTPMDIYRVGDTWATWSHGYEGTVYAPQELGTTVTLTMPPGTRAFQFYAEPNSWDVFDITVAATDGSTKITRPVDGDGGARYFGFYSTGTALIRTITISSDEPFALGELALSSWVDSAYVALGDSYSSGEGAPGSGGGYDGGRCHRSDNSWPAKLSALSTTVHLVANVACSGATTDALLNPFKGQNPQLMELEDLWQARIITITMGGNDIDFAGLLSQCVVEPNGCQAELDDARAGLTRAGGLKDQLTSAYFNVRSSAPYAHLVVVGYPRIFPSSPSDRVKCRWLSDEEIAAARKLSDRLDEVIKAAAGSQGASFVSTLPALRGHEECSKDPWMYPIGISGGQQRGHPDARGQLAIAKLVRSALG